MGLLFIYNIDVNAKMLLHRNRIICLRFLYVKLEVNVSVAMLMAFSSGNIIEG